MSSNIKIESSAGPSPRRHRPRRWIPYAGALVLIGLIVAGLWEQPLQVEITTVSRGALRATVNEEGKTRIKQRFLVSAPVAGQLRRIPFKAGAPVKAGETVLAVIDPLTPALLDARSRSMAEARRDVAAANLEKARVTHDFATNELKRLQRLFKDKTATAQDLDSAQWRETSAARDKAAAESAVRQAESELAIFSPANSANAQTDPTEIKAPAGGRVLKVIEESSRVVTPGMPLVEIGDPAELEVVVEVLSRDGAGIQPGTKVELEQWGGAAPLQAEVRLVEPAAFTKVSALGVEEQRVNVVADLVTPPEQRANVGDHFRVEARIIVWQTNDVLKAPSGALFRRGQDWAAFVLENGRVHLRPVKTGRASDTETQILDGLKEGDQVILYPGDRVQDGKRVKVIKI